MKSSPIFFNAKPQIREGDTYIHVSVCIDVCIRRINDFIINNAILVCFFNRCEIDSSEAALYIKLSSIKLKLLFEMLPGYHTQNFVGEVFRLTESSISENKCFKWLDTYIAGNLVLCLLELIIESNVMIIYSRVHH